MSTAVHNMFSSIAKSYDRTNDFLSLGIHRLWRKQSLKFAGIMPTFPIRVIDLCCGTGDFLLAAQKTVNPFSQLVGLDFVWNMLPLAQKKSIPTNPQQSISYIHGDALNLPFKNNSFDLCTIGFGIRNVDSTIDSLKEMKRVLKQGGIVVVLEFGAPYVPVFKELYKVYSKFIMPLIGQILSGDKAAYQYLPETSAAYPCREKFCDLMKQAEFSEVKYRSFFGGIAYCYVGYNKNKS